MDAAIKTGSAGLDRYGSLRRLLVCSAIHATATPGLKENFSLFYTIRLRHARLLHLSRARRHPFSRYGTPHAGFNFHTSLHHLTRCRTRFRCPFHRGRAGTPGTGRRSQTPPSSLPLFHCPTDSARRLLGQDRAGLATGRTGGTQHSATTATIRWFSPQCLLTIQRSPPAGVPARHAIFLVSCR